MAALEIYLKGARDTRGLQHMSAIKSLRDYINVTKETDMVSAIRAIADIDLLRILIEAGMKPRLMHVVLLHYDRLIKAGGTPK